jgi:hypothetical protein
MDMIILRYKRNRLIFSTVLTTILVLALSFAGYNIVGLLFSFHGLKDSALSGMLLIAIILVAVLIGSACIFMVWVAVSRWSYCIDFNDTFMETHTAHMPFAQQFKCAYDDVVIVRKSGAGVIEIVPRAGKAFRFIPGGFDIGEAAVFDLLSQHIPAERFEPELRNNYKRLSKSEKAIYPLVLTLMFSYVLLIAFQGPHTLIPLPLAWNNFGSWIWLPDPISGFSVESPNSVWVTTHSYTEDTTAVEHMNAGQTQTWYLSNNQANQFDYLQSQILVNSHRQPVLVAERAVYSLKDEQWQKTNYDAGYSSFLSRAHSASIVANEAWVPLYSGEKDTLLLVRIQADAPQPQVITLLDPITQQPVKPETLETTPDGTVLLKANNIIYLLRNGELQKQHYPVAIKNELRIDDFTLAADGNLYVLLAQFSDPEGFIEKIDTKGEQVFTQLQSLPQGTGPTQHYDSLKVDTRGRVWVAGNLPDFVSVVEPQWGGMAHEIVKYDEYNSNYHNGLDNNLLLTSDGRIWAAKTSLIWIDSNAVELPASLPDWLARIRHPEISFFAILACELPALILMVLLNRKSLFRNRK